MTNIGDSALTLCSDLVSVEIPASVTEIGKDAFDPETILHVTAGSYAETSVKENGTPYSVE